MYQSMIPTAFQLGTQTGRVLRYVCEISVAYLLICVAFTIIRRVYSFMVRLAVRIFCNRAAIRTTVRLANLVGAKIDDGVCVYCLENQKSVMLRPCNHMCYCLECFEFF